MQFSCPILNSKRYVNFKLIRQIVTSCGELRCKSLNGVRLFYFGIADPASVVIANPKKINLTATKFPFRSVLAFSLGDCFQLFIIFIPEYIHNNIFNFLQAFQNLNLKFRAPDSFLSFLAMK